MKLLKPTKNLVKNTLHKTTKTTLRFLFLAVMLLPTINAHSNWESASYLLKNKRTTETIKAPSIALQITTEIIKKASSISATDGVIKVIVNGGQATYQLEIINSSNQIVFSSNFSTNVIEVANLAAGTYQISITDGSNSEATASFQMPTENCQLSATLDNQTLTCATDKGSLSPVVADALIPISYQWQHGPTSATVTNLSVGTYTVSISDGSGCEVIKSASIVAPEKLVGISTIVANASTKESVDGQVQLNINGGQKPYRLSIYYSNGNLFSQLSNLGIMTVIDKFSAGQFTYEITDQVNCKTSGDFQVNVENCTFKVSLTEGNRDCSTATGSLTAFAEAGITPYRFLWSNNQSTPTITQLSAGTYRVTATDAGGCESIASATIQNNELLSLSCRVVTQPPSIGAQGKVSIVLKGGLPNYSLALKNQQTGSVVNLTFQKAQEVTLDLLEGSYSISLKDDNNCERTCSFELTNPACGLVGNLSNYIIPCGATTGTLQANATGNSGQLTYKWSNNVFQATNANLALGTYRVSISDALNCVVVKEATVSHAKIDEDGDGYYIGCTDYSQVLGPDCNDKDKNINPSVLEICDGIDNNCDGNIDEGFTDTDGNGIPDCAIIEICDGIDNNGDGNIDEGFADTDGDGIADCQDTEICDGKDNDGDGQIDEGFPDTDGDGTADCQDTEICDGKDNDGDGQIDEGFPDTDGDGTADCQDTETCDGKDNDGDGLVDEGFPDTDRDGTLDCFDNCPNDPTKIEPDECGCGTPPQIDSDGDGIINCLDPCPYDLNQFVDGLIQCGQTITNSTFGGTSAHHSYGDCTTEAYNGREFFYKFELNQPGDLIIRFKELSQSNYRRLGLFVLNDLCQINSCIGFLKSTDSEAAMLVIPNAPKGDYFFVVDARGVYDAAKFELTIACNTGSGQVACGADGLLYEDFEAYPEGADIAAKSQNWALFGNSSRSAFVETVEEGEKENKVLAFRRTNLSDVNFLLKDDFSGIFRLSWTMFIQKGQSAYFNVFGHPSTDDNGLKYIFDQNNSAFQDKWIDIEFFVDLTTNKYTLFINNRQYNQSGDYVVSLGRVNFYAAPYSNFLVDNICYQQVESMPSVASNSRANNKEMVDQVAKSQFANKQLKINANPVQNQLSVDFKFPFPKQQTQLEVYDYLGRRVIHQQLESTAQHTQLDVSNLKNGIYYLNMTNGGLRMMRKFVKVD